MGAKGMCAATVQLMLLGVLGWGWWQSTAFAQGQPEPSAQICLSTCVAIAPAGQGTSPPPMRVVALTWSATEMLLSLGVAPVGVAQGAGYRKWQSNHPPLATGTTDVGRRQEPDLMAVAGLRPDLIIGYDFRHGRLLPALSRIAPTLLYQQFPQPHQADFRYFQQVPIIYRAIARAVGRVAQGERDLTRIQTTLRQRRQQLAQAGLSGASVTYGKFVGMGYGLRVFTHQSMAGSIAAQLGLNYHWQIAMPGKDFTHLQLEQMPQLSGTHLLLADNQSNNDRIILSPVWQQLPFVKDGRLSHTPSLWSFGGPVSVERMANAFSESLLQWQASQDNPEQAAASNHRSHHP